MAIIVPYGTNFYTKIVIGRGGKIILILENVVNF